MRMKKIIIVSIISLVLTVSFCSSAFATEPVVDANFWNSNAWLSYSPGTYFQAQSFMPAKRYLYAVEVMMYPGYDLAGAWGVEIWANDPNADPDDDPRLGAGPLGISVIRHMVTVEPDRKARWVFSPPVDVNDFLNETASVLIYWTNAYERQVPIGGGLYAVYSGVDYPDGTRYFIESGLWHRADNEWDPEYEEYFTWDMGFRTFGADELPTSCEDEGAVKLPGDLNGDCYVDFGDVAEMVSVWLQCTDPNNSDCDQYWY